MRTTFQNPTMLRVFSDNDDFYVLDGGTLSEAWLRLSKDHNTGLLEIDKAYDVFIDRYQAYILSVKLRQYARTGSFSKGNPPEVPFCGSMMVVPQYDLGVDVPSRTAGRPSTATKRKARTPNARTRAMAKKPAPKKATPKSGKKICK